MFQNQLSEKFEEEYGIKVNVSTFSTNEDMLAKWSPESAGAYDIVQPSDYMVKQMADQGMLEELDQSKLTNLENIGDAYLDQTYDLEMYILFLIKVVLEQLV